MARLIFTFTLLLSLTGCMSSPGPFQHFDIKDFPPSWIQFPPENHVAWRSEDSMASYHLRRQIALHRCIDTYDYCQQQDMWADLNGDIWYLFATKMSDRDKEIYLEVIKELYKEKQTEHAAQFGTF